MLPNRNLKTALRSLNSALTCKVLNPSSIFIDAVGVFSLHWQSIIIKQPRRCTCAKTALIMCFATKCHHTREAYVISSLNIIITNKRLLV